MSESLILVQKRDRKERWLLIGTLIWCLLAVNTVIWNVPWGIGMTAAVFGWYVLLFAALGTEALLKRENQVLLVVNLLLGASFALTSNRWFCGWNFMALTALVPIHAFSLSGGTLLPWWRPKMLWERLCLLLMGWFGHLPASLNALAPSDEGKQGQKRTLAVVVGIAAAVMLLALLLPVLASADALFAAATESFRIYIQKHFAAGLTQLIWALVLTPFVFGLITLLRHPHPLRAADRPCKPLDSLGFLMVLVALDVLYLLFLAVQSAGLFGGPAYLEQHGIRYADWARSGFFQMVGVTIVNLSVLLASMTWAGREGGSWNVLRILCVILTGESFLLLASAAWRMGLYISAYGLSFKRGMTCWGMVMMALFFLAALRKVQKPDFSFCRVVFPMALAGWLVINCIPLDRMTARDQVERYLSGERQSLSLAYLCGLSYDTLPQLERLAGRNVLIDGGVEISIDEILSAQRDAARSVCAHWQSWNLSAWCAGGF